MERRNFLKTTGLFSGGLMLAACGLNSNEKNPKRKNIKSGKMTLSFEPYDLKLTHTFTLANSSRDTTPVVLVKLDYEGYTGYGEASLPPYLGETQESVMKFLSKVDLTQFNDPFLIEEIDDYIDGIEKNNRAAKASVDIALHDLIGKMLDTPLYKMWGLNPKKTPNTSFTIGIDTEEVIKEKLKEAEQFKILKIKLGRENDKQMVETIRSVTDVKLCVDVNQGWKDKHLALDMIHWLNERNVAFVEQPMPKTMMDEMAWLTENSPLPTVADEAFQRLDDVARFKGVYSGINIKLMKSTGLHEAHKMITIARALDMKVMMGCMTETSCAVSAAAQLSPLVDWADLDGNLLIDNDIYEGVKVIDGKITLNELPGIGIKEI